LAERFLCGRQSGANDFLAAGGPANNSVRTPLPFPMSAGVAGALLQVVVVPAPLDHWALHVIPLGSLRGCCNWLPSDHRIVPEDTIATFDINVNTPHRRAPRSVVSNALDRGIDT
jgi:hypothetical protein